jgi:hypothetical protein
MKRLAVLVLALLLTFAIPASAANEWVVRGGAVGNGSADRNSAGSVGFSTAALEMTQGRVSGIRVRVRTIDGKPADVTLVAEAVCSSGSSGSIELDVLTTKADKAWTTLTLLDSGVEKRGQCWIDADVYDPYGTKASGLHIQILTKRY